MKILNRILVSSIFLIYSSFTDALPVNQFYVAVDAGIFKAQFNNKYLDQSDLIPQNITNSSMQNGYTGGLTLGYTRLLNTRYFMGFELSGNLDGNSALFQSGAANTAFSDQIQMNNHVDFTVIPGVMTQSGFFPYIKLGISRASINDNLTSPVGYDPIMTRFNSNQNSFGFVAGLGVRYLSSDHSWIYVEENYHDYGTVNFSAFQNFSANYSHSAHIYSYATLIGASYAFNV